MHVLIIAKYTLLIRIKVYVKTMWAWLITHRVPTPSEKSHDTLHGGPLY